MNNNKHVFGLIEIKVKKKKNDKNCMNRINQKIEVMICTHINIYQVISLCNLNYEII